MRRTAPCAASCCARAGCPRRSSARSTRCCRAGESRSRRRTLDFAAAFGRVAPVILEIGFGMGETTAAIAAAHPAARFPRPRSARPRRRRAAQSHRRRGSHQRARDPARRRRRRRADDSAPARWPASTSTFPIRGPRSAITSGACCSPRSCTRSRSGWRPAATCTRRRIGTSTRRKSSRRFAAEPLLANTAADFAPRPAWRPQTKFEARGLQARPRRARRRVPAPLGADATPRQADFLRLARRRAQAR